LARQYSLQALIITALSGIVVTGGANYLAFAVQLVSVKKDVDGASDKLIGLENALQKLAESNVNFLREVSGLTATVANVANTVTLLTKRIDDLLTRRANDGG
jgi:hypothetical protein